MQLGLSLCPRTPVLSVGMGMEPMDCGVHARGWRGRAAGWGGRGCGGCVGGVSCKHIDQRVFGGSPFLYLQMHRACRDLLQACRPRCLLCAYIRGGSAADMRRSTEVRLHAYLFLVWHFVRGGILVDAPLLCGGGESLYDLLLLPLARSPPLPHHPCAPSTAGEAEWLLGWLSRWCLLAFSVDRRACGSSLSPTEACAMLPLLCTRRP